MSEELKPCPFCGGKPSFRESYNGGDVEWYVSCCTVRTLTYYERNEAATAWNARAPDLLAENERLRAEVDKLRIEAASTGYSTCDMLMREH